MFETNDCPENCYQGSTDFYISFTQDENTPALSQAAPLIDTDTEPPKDNIGARWENGEYPPWMVEGSEKSSARQYVEWFNGIWHTGDPSTWNETVFTPGAVMIDASGRSTGAKQAAARFLLIFKFFPGLRGEVVSWAANDREILINWRFQVLKKGGKASFLVPVVDKFSFVAGRVSFRIAFFDLGSFVGYLSQTYGLDQVTDFLIASFKQSYTTGGLQSLPSIVWNLVSGLFFWPKPPATRPSVTADDGIVTLSWQKVDKAIAYKVTRAEALSGNAPDGSYVAPWPDGGLVDEPKHTYEDSSVTPGVPYWYLVSPVYAKWEPTEVRPDAPMSMSPGRRERLRDWGFALDPEHIEAGVSGEVSN